MDPLEALRSGIAKSRKLERVDGNIIIGKYAFPDNTYTCMKKLNAYEKHESVKETSYYTLDCVYFCWTVFSKNPNTEIGTYIEMCASNNVGVINFNQVPALMKYLNKKDESCIYFDAKASFRYVKPLFTGSLGKPEAAEGDSKTTIGIDTYKRMRAIIGNEKIYKTRSKMINLEGSSSFTEAIDLIRRDEKKKSTQDEDWKGRMDVSDININLEEGFLTQPVESTIREAIIIVPPSAGANVLTMFNIEKFMNEGVYESSEELKKKSPLKPQEVIVNHTIHNRKMRFRFIDNPSRLDPADWKRVVCVMTGSQAWQFRGWRYSNPTELFSRYLGVFVWFSDSPVPAIVNTWNVKVVTIHRDVRNMDSVASVQFWDMVEKEIKTKRTELLKYNVS